MSKARQGQYEQIKSEGTLLGSDGSVFRGGIPEVSVYVAPDRFVYHFVASEKRSEITVRIAGKRTIGEYLRWVDGLFRSGEVPDESNAVHYRAARKLREML
jgi:hypothetical protein